MRSKPMTARPRARWAAAWVGRSAEDCAEFGHDLILPRTPGSLCARDRVVADIRAIFARALGHHIVLWTGETGTACVLHHMAGLGSCLHPLARLDDRGLTCTGLYRWL